MQKGDAVKHWQHEGGVVQKVWTVVDENEITARKDGKDTTTVVREKTVMTMVAFDKPGVGTLMIPAANLTPGG